MHHETHTISAGHVPHAPLILGTLARTRRRDLAAALGASGPVRRGLAAPGADDGNGGGDVTGGLSAVIDEALADPRDARERVVDSVVERLLAELSW